MALKYITGELHETLKVFRGSCSKCGSSICVGWQISKVLANAPQNKKLAQYCYDCTKNSWSKSFKIYLDSLVPNAVLSGKPPHDEL